MRAKVLAGESEVVSDWEENTVFSHCYESARAINRAAARTVCKINYCDQFIMIAGAAKSATHLSDNWVPNFTNHLPVQARTQRTSN